MTKKIVVTGVGAASPLGGTAAESWKALLAGESGARTIEKDWVSELDLPVTFAAQAKVDAVSVLGSVVVRTVSRSAKPCWSW